ncbi:MAG TPA: family 16 glycosylhydrolase [Acidobacteriaceae bacterium]|jgi:beta-glucanase (GH16 family)|nr:family 16 glycosylhydrolase [Acidobacteriaceae bacterium]
MDTLSFPAFAGPHVCRPLLRSSVRLALVILLVAGCGGSSPKGGAMPPPNQPAATPSIATSPAQNGAVIVTLSDTTANAVMHYTVDGSAPTSSSPQYFAPFLVAANLTVNAVATAPPLLTSAAATRTFSPNLASGTLVWSDEFANTGSSNIGPSTTVWTYDTGTDCCGNNELETYCAYGSSTPPCSTGSPNAYIGTDGYLHIEALSPSPGVYTSARLKSQGLFTFQYGRIEARMQLPESQGMWPAFWMLGSNITAVPWPACGEADIMEHIDGANPPFSAGGVPPGYDWIAGSVHGGASTSTEVNGSQRFNPAAFSAAAWHTYGMIWSKGQIQFYVDDPSNIYATFNTSNFGGTWPFDQGPMFIILNLAVGGDWPGNPDSTTAFPSNMLVDYVRIYTN